MDLVLARTDAAALRAVLYGPPPPLPTPASIEFVLAADFVTTQPAASSNEVALSTRPGKQPDLDQPRGLKEITIATPTGWWLSIAQDGSGALGFGLIPVHSFRPLPAGWFDFQKACRALATSARADGSSKKDFVVLLAAQDHAVAGRYTEDRVAVLGLFDRAFQSVSTTRWDTLGEVRKTHPIIQPRAKSAPG